MKVNQKPLKKKAECVREKEYILQWLKKRLKPGMDLLPLEHIEMSDIITC